MSFFTPMFDTPGAGPSYSQGQLGAAFAPSGPRSIATPSGGSRKRKDMDSESDEDSFVAGNAGPRKIAYARRAGPGANLSLDVSPAVFYDPSHLAAAQEQVRMIFEQHRSRLPPTPETSPSQGYFGLANAPHNQQPCHDSSVGSFTGYPNVNPYPNFSPGVMGPVMGSDTGMAVDGAANSHGAHCRAIPQLFVKRLVDAQAGCFELWARCSDCGGESKVETGADNDALSYSP
ncbi:hypothetical protein CBOM_02484 [Ceraceosorus bombacis]|uniref:Uncharacterized protein n=1 Tax=Ceraceosorus bombacis TaxID=401625 RepID=A0A0N7L9T2_9BASI|nr:hypothetical protein CBOM_02484 [Ceraceosorus bombacis]